MPRGCLQFVIVVFPDHTHLLFLKTYFNFNLFSISIMHFSVFAKCVVWDANTCDVTIFHVLRIGILFELLAITPWSAFEY